MDEEDERQKMLARLIENGKSSQYSVNPARARYYGPPKNEKRKISIKHNFFDNFDENGMYIVKE